MVGRASWLLRSSLRIGVRSVMAMRVGIEARWQQGIRIQDSDCSSWWSGRGQYSASNALGGCGLCCVLDSSFIFLVQSELPLRSAPLAFAYSTVNVSRDARRNVVILCTLSFTTRLDFSQPLPWISSAPPRCTAPNVSMSPLCLRSARATEEPAPDRRALAVLVRIARSKRRMARVACRRLSVGA
jgi:hypothetical protein